VPYHRTARESLQYVAAGVLYLVLSAIAFAVWIVLDGMVMLFLAVALSTVVAGLVELTVGWHDLSRSHRRTGATRRR
jgi:hypothetical protein